jgi:hypothetical protein
MKPILFIVLIFLALAITGKSDYQQAIEDARIYCENTRATNIWPDFNDQIDCTEHGYEK